MQLARASAGWDSQLAADQVGIGDDGGQAGAATEGTGAELTGAAATFAAQRVAGW